MENLTLSERVLGVIDALEPGNTLEEKVIRLAENELRRRLVRYQLADRQFRAKYNMTLEEFEAGEVVRRANYAFDVESDHQDWDLAIDGMRSVERQLQALQSET